VRQDIFAIALRKLGLWACLASGLLQFPTHGWTYDEENVLILKACPQIFV
jgi:hypothetical protein